MTSQAPTQERMATLLTRVAEIEKKYFRGTRRGEPKPPTGASFNRILRVKAEWKELIRLRDNPAPQGDPVPVDWAAGIDWED